MWPVALSGRLPVVALVSHYLTNKLIGREPIPDRKTFHTMTMRPDVVSGISSGFPGLFQSLGQVTHVLLTRSPLITKVQAPQVTVRLACVKHAASVRPEPGSNSPLMNKHPLTTHAASGQLIHTRSCETRLSTNNQQKLFVRHQPKEKLGTTSTLTPNGQGRKAMRRGKNWHRFLTRC